MISSCQSGWLFQFSVVSLQSSIFTRPKPVPKRYFNWPMSQLLFAVLIYMMSKNLSALWQLWYRRISTWQLGSSKLMMSLMAEGMLISMSTISNLCKHLRKSNWIQILTLLKASSQYWPSIYLKSLLSRCLLYSKAGMNTWLLSVELVELSRLPQHVWVTKWLLQVSHFWSSQMVKLKSWDRWIDSQPKLTLILGASFHNSRSLTWIWWQFANLLVTFCTRKEW